MTISKAEKVTKRGWSLDKFAKSVRANCKRANVKFEQGKIKALYDAKLSVRGAVAVLGS